MVLDLDVSNAGVRAQALLEATGAATAGIPVFWGGATYPNPLPASFITIEPLFPTEWRSWGEQRAVTHTIQIRASARSVGGSTALRAAIANLLPPTEFGTVTHGPTIKVDAHFDSILTVTTVTATKETE